MLLRNHTGRRALMMLCVAALCSACSHQDFGRPLSSPISDMLRTKQPLIESNQEQLAEARARKFDEALANWQRHAHADAASYHIGIEDVVRLEILSLEAAGKPSELTRTVDNNGMVNLSWAGNVKVAGLTVPEAEAAILKHLENGYIKNPNVTLKVAEFKSAGVIITGAVSKPGVYYLESDRRTLLEVLSLAGGLDTKSGDELLLIRGKQSLKEKVTGESSETNSVIVVDLERLIDGGDLRANLWVQRGDIITVQSRVKQYVSVLGYVARPGSFDISEKEKMTALDALGLAGGLTPTARAENSWLLRQTTNGQKTVKLDITAMARGMRPALYLEAGDTLFIGSSAFAKLAEFITPSVTAGASFSPVP